VSVTILNIGINLTLLVGTYFFTPALYFPFLFSSGKETLLSDDELHFYWLMCGVLDLFFYFFVACICRASLRTGS
jgi:hypothetical protein